MSTKKLSEKISFTKMILLEWEKIMEYDFYPYQEYLVALSHKVRSFQ